MKEVNQNIQDAYNAMVDAFGEDRVDTAKPHAFNKAGELEVIITEGTLADQDTVLGIFEKYDDPNISVSGFEGLNND